MPEPARIPPPNYHRQVPRPGAVVRRLVETTQGAVTETETGERFLDVVASDESTDRYGDVIVAAGWNLSNFQRNPVALWAHDHGAPIGTVENIRIDGRRLLGRMHFAAAGVS